GTLVRVRDLHDRHRRFRRNALNVAEPVAVEHDVADDQHRGVRDTRAPRRKAALLTRLAVARYPVPAHGERGWVRGVTICAHRRPIDTCSKPAPRTKSGS